MEWHKIEEQLEEIGAPSLSAHRHTLSLDGQEALKQTLSQLDPLVIALLRSAIQNTLKTHSEVHPPPVTIPQKLCSQKESESASLILAGGEGSRLGYKGPKGCYLLPLPKPRSLFQIAAERLHSLPHPPPLAILTSASNYSTTRDYLSRHNNFSLPSLHLPIQGSLPLLDPEGNPFLTTPIELAMGPDGNGHALHILHKKGILQLWRTQGIRYIHIAPIDNPLAHPCDPELVYLLEETGAELLLRVVERRDEEEKIGIPIASGERLYIAEYSEIDPQHASLRDSKGELFYRYGNTNLFSLTLECAEKMAALAMPLHIANKKAKRFNTTKGENQEIPCSKGEYFLFDILPHTRAQLIVSDRNLHFAPLKNATGNDSPQSVSRAWIERETKAFFRN